MNIKKGDKVIVLSGKDKGKTGTVQVVYPKLDKVVVEGINVHKKHRKPTQSTPEGSIVDMYVPFDASKGRADRSEDQEGHPGSHQSREWQEGSRRQVRREPR
jgi:ribosomal protein L24